MTMAETTVRGEPELDAVSGVQLAQGAGHRPAQGFWAEAWGKVLRRPSAIAGLAWIGIVAFFAVLAPLLANGHPVLLTDGEHGPVTVFLSRGLGAFFDPAVGLSGLVAAVLAGIGWVASPSRGPGWFIAGAGVALGAGYACAGAPLFGLVDGGVWQGWVLAVLAGIGAGWFAMATGAPRSFRAWTCWVPVVIAACVVLPEAGAGDGGVLFRSPMFRFLTAVDVLLLVGTGVLVLLMVGRLPGGRAAHVWGVVVGGVQAGLVVLVAAGIEAKLNARDVSDAVRELRGQDWLVPAVGCGLGLVSVLLGVLALPVEDARRRVVLAAGVGVVAAWVVMGRWGSPLERFGYARDEAAGKINALYAPVPWSPRQGSTSLQVKPPVSTVYAAARDSIVDRLANDQGGAVFADDPRFGASRVAGAPRLGEMVLDEQAVGLVEGEIRLARPDLSEPVSGVLDDFRGAVEAGEVGTIGDALGWLDARPARRFWLGTDSLGQDVLTQLLHACRLSISIGLVSTSIAVAIGVTMGALMGYFGGWVDMVLYRVVEIFMAVPVLFLLIVAAGVLPRNTYVMMAIIGCFSWTGAARFTRAEFLKLRNQDFVHSARAAALPLHRVLFRHILPNGVTPVLVDASFLIAAAISIEVTLSYLGLGPPNQASWGRLLSDATNELGQFVWWLAIVPGVVIFLTVLSYNLIGEALRDAIDPKLGKARV